MTMVDARRVNGAEKRTERRITASLPITFDDIDCEVAFTRDVSASGLFFETDAFLTAGALVHLQVEMNTPAGKRVLKCQGSIVRVESLNHRLGCAIKILDSRLVKP